MDQMFIIFPFLLGVTCHILFNFMGSYIDKNGILQEAFYFIPLMFIFLAISLVNFLGYSLINKIKEKKL